MFGGMLMSPSMRSSQYEEIVNSPRSDQSSRSSSYWDAKTFFTSWPPMKVATVGMVLLLTGIIIVQGVQEHGLEVEQLELQEDLHEKDYQHQVETNYYQDKLLRSQQKEPFVEHNSEDIPIPPGVNLGSWLSLEDYFFTGLHNSIEVATPGFGQTANKVAACLPPLHVGSTTGPKWYSETDLFRNLMDPNITKGGSVKHAIEVFAAHRSSFIDLETDLQRIKALGVTTVRVPMSWCFKDADPRHVQLKSYASDEALLEDFACVDPFFANGNDHDEYEDAEPILWPAVPKPLVEDLLRACAKAGLKASLDVHTHAGGTSIGTFSGVWPHWPRFWTHGGDGVGVNGSSIDETSPGFGIGHKVVRDLVEWMEELSDRDPVAFSGLRGLSPMNEPAHLSGNFAPNATDNFLPPLPKDVESDFLGYLPSHYPSGTHLRVFYWFQGAMRIFRNSKLPSLGKELQVNIIESIFRDPVTDTREIASWWCTDGSRNSRKDYDTTNPNLQVTTTPEDRSDWAVLDVHHYHAWNVNCSGTTDGQDAGYTCGDATQRSEILKLCAEFVPTYRNDVDDICGVTPDDQKPSKLMSAEFSPASHHSVRHSCTDVSGLKESYTQQVEAGQRADVELFYWSYKMPYGGSFKHSGWSFSELLYKFGVLARPDSTHFSCDSHLYDDPELP